MRHFLICSIIAHGVVFGVWGNHEFLRYQREQSPVVQVTMIPDVPPRPPSTLSVALKDVSTVVNTRPKIVRRHVLFHRVIHDKTHRETRRQRIAVQLLDIPELDPLDQAAEAQTPDREVTPPPKSNHRKTLRAALPDDDNSPAAADKMIPAAHTTGESPRQDPLTSEEEIWADAAETDTEGAEQDYYEPVKKGDVVLPPYPRSAREKGYEGTVMLRVLVTSDGDVADAVVEQSSGFTVLDEVALDAVKRWKFTPARRNGAAVQASVVVPVRFKLTN